MLLIVALGVAFYVGIRASGPDMELSADRFYDDTNFMDIRVLSTLGMTEEDVTAIAAIDGVSEAQGAYEADYVCAMDSKEYVVTAFSLCDSINRMTLQEGRLPQRADECFADALIAQNTGLKIGDQITLRSGTEDALEDTLCRDTFTIVGIGTYSRYLSWDRGSTSIGNGDINFFLGLSPEAFSMEAYTAVYASVNSADSLNCYSTDYSDAIVQVTERIESIADARCQIRFDSVHAEAISAIEDAQQEIDDAQRELDDAQAELEDARIQLDEAQAELLNGEQELADGYLELEQSEQELADGETQLKDGRKALQEAETELADRTAELNEKSQELKDGQKELAKQKASLNDVQNQLDTFRETLTSQQSQLDSSRALAASKRGELETQQHALLEQQESLLSQRGQLTTALEGSASQRAALVEQKEAAEQGIALYEQKAELENQSTIFQEQLNQIQSTINALTSARAPYDEQLAALHGRQSDLEQQFNDLNARLETLNQQQQTLQARQAELQDAYTMLNGLFPDSWTSVAGYQAMLNRMSSLPNHLSGQTERAICQKVRDAVNAALNSGEEVTDDLLKRVVPGAANAAIGTAASSLNAEETRLTEDSNRLQGEAELLSKERIALEKAQAELESQMIPLQTSIEEFDRQAADLISQQNRLINAIAEIDAALPAVDAALSSIGHSQAELSALVSQLEQGIQQIDSLQENLATLESGIAQIEEALLQIDAGFAQIDAGQAEMDQAEAQLQAGWTQLETSEQQLKAGRKQLQAAQAQLDSGARQLEDGKRQLADGQAQLQEKKSELADAEKKLTDGRQALQEGYEKLEEAEKELQEGREELESHQAEYDQGLIDYQEALAEAQPELDDARQQVADAQDALDELGMPEWYVLDRSSIQTFVEYGMDADRIRAIGQVIPIIFFLVAALVSLTGMTRMVEEERGQIGTLKALGYGKLSIASKYFLYAFSSSLLGSVLGVLLGSRILPYVIISAYSILYSTLTIMLTPINWALAALALLLAVFCTVFAAMAACMRTLRETPASLMRPASPPKGKRVFLEFIPVLWHHLSFGQKAAARNLFRYKKRLFMTIFGIAGCTALLLVGFGLRDSIQKIVDTQYSSVWTYDASLTADSQSLDDLSAQLSGEDWEVNDILTLYQSSMDAEANDRRTDAYLFVPREPEKLEHFVHLQDRVTQEPYSLSEDGVIITEKLSTLLGLTVGDELTLCRSETEKYTARITAIAENYLYHYVYMTPAYYQSLFGKAPEYTQLFLDTAGETDDSFAERLLALDSVSAVSMVTALEEKVSEMMGSMNMVIWVLIISAGLLAFIVLYNLNNISILERRRELATLRVLGFYDGELAMYMYRENVVLTLMGIAAGIALGLVLHKFIIGTCEIDMIMFGRVIHPLSYLLSVAMTLLFAALVNSSMFFRLRKIDMVESLKSVE